MVFSGLHVMADVSRTHQVDQPRHRHAPRLAPLRPRTETVPLCTSLSPTTSMYGIFGFFCFTDLEPDLFIANIALQRGNPAPSSSRRRPAAYSCCLSVIVQNDAPGPAPATRERAGIMFDEDAEESFDGAHQRPVNHDRLMRLPVFAGIGQIESLRIIEIHLDGRALP